MGQSDARRVPTLCRWLAAFLSLPQFVSGSVYLTLGILQKLFNLVAFTGVLWSVSPRMVAFLLCYAAAGTWITTSVFGRQLVSLQFKSLKRCVREN